MQGLGVMDSWGFQLAGLRALLGRRHRGLFSVKLAASSGTRRFQFQQGTPGDSYPGPLNPKPIPPLSFISNLGFQRSGLVLCFLGLGLRD